MDCFAEANAAGNLHCLTLEGLRDNPEETLNAIYTFLGLPAGSYELPVSNSAASTTPSSNGTP